MRVSVHEFKNHLSKYLLLLKTYHQVIIITSHQAPVARLLPIENINISKNAKSVMTLAGINWNGKKPQGGHLLPTIEGKNAADYVMEDRG